MSTADIPRHSRTFFWAYVIGFIAIYGAFYPRTYAIEDEFNILSLAVSLSRGTVLLDRAGLDLDADLLWNGHTISKFSPFHAAFLTPAVISEWRLAFGITAAFAVVGAFVFRGMVQRAGLSSNWVALYFLIPGIWFYSRTVMAAVPASVMLLLGASFLLRTDANRPAVAGVALGISGLLHPWMIPVSAALVLGWWCDAPRARLRSLVLLLAAAAPAAILLLAYNNHTTGSPFRNAYSLMGTHLGFKGENVGSFLPLYAVSLALMPVGGWTALSRRWSAGLAIPAAVATVIGMASIYYYRDGLGYGAAGLLPAQRFLIPASMLACLPAARWLSHVSHAMPVQLSRRARTAAYACFLTGFLAVSVWHGTYLNAHAEVQGAIRSSIPDGSRVLVGDRAFKEFAPVLGEWRLLQLRGRMPTDLERSQAYAVWIAPPGGAPPEGWFGDPAPRRVAARSWVWNRDVWIGGPDRPANDE
jgi:hypothetical protein